MAALTNEQLIEREELKTLFKSIKKITNGGFREVEKAFEEYGCSCSSERVELVNLEVEYRQALKIVAEAQSKLKVDFDHSELGQRYLELQESIRETDRKEHPDLDREARKAEPFFHSWLLQQVKGSHKQLLHEGAHQAYVEAWYGGWRP